MKEHLPVLKATSLFSEFDDKNILLMLTCLSATKKNYQTNEIMFIAGSSFPKVGIVLEGAVKITKEDISGEVTIIDEFRKKDMFGEAFVAANIKYAPVTITSIKNSTVLYIDLGKLISTCQSNCTFHTHLIKNMLKIMGSKLISLNQKIEVIQKKTIRDKLITYFEINIIKNDSKEFKIPFNREELAEYLGVNRSALSRELGNMRNEGLIDFHKNNFVIKL